MIGLAEAQKKAEGLIAELKPYCKRIEVAGSIRRKCPTVKDMELVVIPDPQYMQPLYHKIFGHTRIKGAMGGRYIQIMLAEYFKADIFFATEENWGLIFAIRTGSADFSKRLAREWVKLGCESKDGTLYGANGNPVVLHDEADLFFLLGYSEVPKPENRNL